jgi:hypothetical protein
MFVSRSKTHRRLALVLGGLAIATMSWPVAAGNLQTRGPLQVSRDRLQAARHFSASLAIRHRRLLPSGTVHGPAMPEVVMRLTREFRAGRWRTALELERPPDLFADISGGRAPIHNPFLISRIEMNDDEETPRMYDRAGRQVRAMTMADLPVLGAAETLRQKPVTGGRALPAVSWLAEAGRESERREELVRSLGTPVGRVRGLDHYATRTATGRHDVLVAPDTALPVELTSTSDAAEVQTGVEYLPYGSFGYVRRFLRSEHRLLQAAERSVTEVELAHIVISDEVTP